MAVHVVHVMPLKRLMTLEMMYKARSHRGLSLIGSMILPEPPVVMVVTDPPRPCRCHMFLHHVGEQKGACFTLYTWNLAKNLMLLDSVFSKLWPSVQLGGTEAGGYVAASLFVSKISQKVKNRF